MDEAFVLLAWSLADDDSPNTLYAFPFATRQGAEHACKFLHGVPGVTVEIIDDHEAE